MNLIQIRNEPPSTPRGWAPLALGFRPFFLLAGASAVAIVLLWLAVLRGWLPAPARYGPIGWHAHEMVFGYSVAVIAGFLLTAVGNWTGRRLPTGATLGGLAVVWAAGRAVPWFGAAVPGVAVAAVGAAFLPLLAVVIALPIVAARNARNLPVVAVVAALAILQLVAEATAGTATAVTATRAAVDLIVVLIALIGGRVIPFFTERRLSGATPRRRPTLDRLGMALLVAVGAAKAALPWGPAAAVLAPLAAAGAVAHGVRLAGWFDRRIAGEPLLWILHLGYAWLPLGLALDAAAALGAVPASLALHAYTAGAIGALTLGMMARVALGHTGRVLSVPRGGSVAFALVSLSAAVRVLVPWLWPGGAAAAWTVAGLCWAAAFAWFVAAYAGVLMRPRVDGKPG